MSQKSFCLRYKGENKKAGGFFMKVKKILQVTVYAVFITLLSVRSIALGGNYNNEDHITPFWINTTRAEIEVGNSKGFITVSAEVRGKATVQSIDGTITLQKRDGNTWINIYEWPISGTNKAIFQKKERSNGTAPYRAIMNVLVDGEQINKTSNIINT